MLYNIVIVIAPLNSIIEVQVSTLTALGVSSDVLRLRREKSKIPGLFNDISPTAASEERDQYSESLEVSSHIINGHVHILFCHPEAILSLEGRKLIKSDLYQECVIFCVIRGSLC